MTTINKSLALFLVTGSLWLVGCQASNEVLVREPGVRLYNPPVEAATMTRTSWEYAALSEIVYDWKYEETPESCPPPPERPELIDQMKWIEWEDFPSAELKKRAKKYGLHVEVWEAKASSIVVVAFRGTEASFKDWISNLRWFIPFRKDQYTLVAQDVGREFVNKFSRIPLAERKEITIIVTGHSLGGGLAQHFAYSLPGRSSQIRVSRVYAFDPSPVTGWFSIDDTDQRDLNASGLKIDRVFEHGEILAYIRLLLSYVIPPSEENPSVKEIRYNFIQTLNPFKNHSMIELACWMKNPPPHP